MLLAQSHSWVLQDWMQWKCNKINNRHSILEDKEDTDNKDNNLEFDDSSFGTSILEENFYEFREENKGSTQITSKIIEEIMKKTLQL